MSRVIDLGSWRGLLDIAIYGRGYSREQRAQAAAEIAHAIRTARCAPEVVVKVSGGARSARGVGSHLDYIGREGEQEIETDDGQQSSEPGFEQRIIRDWDLDLEERKGSRQRAITTRRKPPKLVHNIVFSMPKGTPPEKLRAAVRKFAQEKFALQHRYLMTLHTDQPQPHVHLVVKAVSEQGVRLNIRKATLREWRRDFAAQLRELGVEANATERAVRGVSKPYKIDGIYRASLRGESTHYAKRVWAVADELKRGSVQPKPGLTTLTHTRQAVIAGWHSLADILDADGRRQEAKAIRMFVAQMPRVRTEKQWIAERLLLSLENARTKSPPELTR